jgi:hypothetical protein
VARRWKGLLFGDVKLDCATARWAASAKETLSPSFADADSAKKQAMSNNNSRMESPS